jgi:predicted MFS family arabinose efflux permease
VFGSARRGRAISTHGSAQFAGIALGGWLGGWIAQMWGWRAACFALGGLGLAYTALLWPGLRDIDGLAIQKQEEAKDPARQPLLLAALGAGFFVMCVMLWMLYAWLPDVIHERFGLSLAASGVNATLFLQLSSAAGLIGGGALGDWLRRRFVSGRFVLVAAGLAGAAPFAWWIFSASSLVVLRACAVAFGLFSAIMLSNVMAAAYDITPRKSWGATAGMMTLVGGFGGGGATLAAGMLRSRFHPSELMLHATAAALVAAAGLAACVTLENHRHDTTKLRHLR